MEMAGVIQHKVNFCLVVLCSAQVQEQLEVTLDIPSVKSVSTMDSLCIIFYLPLIVNIASRTCKICRDYLKPF